MLLQSHGPGQCSENPDSLSGVQFTSLKLIQPCVHQYRTRFSHHVIRNDLVFKRKLVYCVAHRLFWVSGSVWMSWSGFWKFGFAAGFIDLVAGLRLFAHLKLSASLFGFSPEPRGSSNDTGHEVGYWAENHYVWQITKCRCVKSREAVSFRKIFSVLKVWGLPWVFPLMTYMHTKMSDIFIQACVFRICNDVFSVCVSVLSSRCVYL